MVRLAPAPRPLDWAIAGTVVLLVGSGIYSLTVGDPAGAWVWVVHAVAGFALVPMVGWKLWRVRARVTPGRLNGRRAFSILLGVTAIAALGTGVWWVLGGSIRVGPWGLLMVHMSLGTAVAVLLAIHLLYRYHSPGSAVDRSERRDVLRYAAVVGAGALVWRGQNAVNSLLDTAGADRRFTGSRERGSGEGNAFPVTSWVADDPDPIEAESWSLDVRGRVAIPDSFGVADIGLDAGVESRASGGEPLAPDGEPLASDGEPPALDAHRRAVLDCTSGWYSEHDWQGVAVGDLLDAVEPDDRARWVQFRSVTGYRWSLPIEEARDALLATHVDGERLSHDHGFPMRLVAPDRRGFQWVKWVVEVRVSRRRDPSEWVAIFVSGLDE